MDQRRSRNLLTARIAAPWVGAILLAIGVCAGVNAQECEMAKLLASDGDAIDVFGRSVAVSADVAVVGAPYDDDYGASSGSAYVYRWEVPYWVETKLLASDGAANEYFGTSVALSGDVAVVGAERDNDNGSNSGSAYVYRWNGASWIETKLLASDGASLDYFGTSVAVSGDVAVVGAPDDDDNGAESGSAYVYRWNGASWVETKLLASDGAAYDRFGESVAVSDDVAVVGAYWDDDNGTQSGSAYVYR
ncbi:MAG: FG-GAP repeat protein, partial [Planctomycetota bacterium]